MVAFMRYYHNKSIQLLFLGRVDIMMKFVVFLDVDGVLNTRTTVKRTPSDYTGSAGSNTGTYSQKKYDHVKENTMSTMNNQKDNRPAYETDTNPNHHYIADYRSFGGIKLFKVHDSMGDYIMLDNSITSRKICNLKEAESGKHKFYRRENGKEINIAEIPWK